MKKQKILIAVLMTLGLVLGASGATMWPEAHAADAATAPQVLAVKFHADWCKSCKAIEPHLDDLKKKFAGQPVLFVTLDLTTDETTQQAGYLSSMLGIDKAWHANAPKTGYVLLIDVANKRIVDKLTKKQDTKSMSDMLTRALRTASSKRSG